VRRRGDYASAKRLTAKILKLSCVFLLAVNISIFVFMEQLVGLFGLSLEAQELAKSFLRIHCISIALGWSMSFALPSALRAAGDARYVMIIAIISMWIVRVSFAYLFAFVLGLGPLGVWVAMGADFAVRGISYLLRWIGGKWQEKRAITN